MRNRSALPAITIITQSESNVRLLGGKGSDAYTSGCGGVIKLGTD